MMEKEGHKTHRSKSKSPLSLGASLANTIAFIRNLTSLCAALSSVAVLNVHFELEVLETIEVIRDV
jgi:hypothetical protein|tara:strand:- start:228 stop:425 length:198 start_codon:yes stop_codon:yes gene_type:complete